MALDKTKVVYQIYPKSYKDTTGNGIGDFRGIIEKIPYLAELGVDMVWLNPFYPSPQRDNGYDISDYTAVNPVFGDMADFEEMVRVGKEHKIDFMLDMVLNHCSTEHEWFQKALAGDKYYQDFFFIQPRFNPGSRYTKQGIYEFVSWISCFSFIYIGLIFLFI